MFSKEDRTSIEGSAAKTLMRFITRPSSRGLEEQFRFNSRPFTAFDEGGPRLESSQARRKSICQNDIRRAARMIGHSFLLFMVPGLGHAKRMSQSQYLACFDDKNAIVYTAGVETVPRIPIPDVGNMQ